MNKKVIGFTQGTYDMFHIGHLNLLRNAKTFCDYLCVGVNSDKLVESYKNRKTIVSWAERAEIVSNIKCVDEVICTETLNKLSTWMERPYDRIFIGDDWKGNMRWKETELVLAEVGAQVIYLPYTKETCSTWLREKLLDC